MIALLLTVLACAPADREVDSDPQGSGDPPVSGAPVADVVSVTATGQDGAWTFAVGIRSDETGCDQYADWWELLTPEGALLYRRVLRHSHPDEQPFTRAGEAPVDLLSTDPVRVRAHLNTTGYGGTVFGGDLDGGFAAVEVAGDFAADVESAAPLPVSCLY